MRLPGLVFRVGLTDVTQQGKDSSFPQATAENRRDAVSVEHHTALTGPPASSASQIDGCWAPGSWLEATGAVVLAGIAPGSVSEAAVYG